MNPPLLRLFKKRFRKLDSRRVFSCGKAKKAEAKKAAAKRKEKHRYKNQVNRAHKIAPLSKTNWKHRNKVYCKMGKNAIHFFETRNHMAGYFLKKGFPLPENPFSTA